MTHRFAVAILMLLLPAAEGDKRPEDSTPPPRPVPPADLSDQGHRLFLLQEGGM
jgi:hypothetical protein